MVNYVVKYKKRLFHQGNILQFAEYPILRIAWENMRSQTLQYAVKHCMQDRTSI